MKTRTRVSGREGFCMPLTIQERAIGSKPWRVFTWLVEEGTLSGRHTPHIR